MTILKPKITFSLVGALLTLALVLPAVAQELKPGSIVVVVDKAKLFDEAGKALADVEVFAGLPLTVLKSKQVTTPDGNQEIWLQVNYRHQGWLPSQFVRTPEVALELFRKRVVEDPKNVDWSHAEGITLGVMRRHDEAVKVFDRMLAKDPDNAGFLNERAGNLMSLKRFELAENDFGRLIELQPNVPTFYFNRALCRRQAGNNELAVADLNKAIELNPRLFAAYQQKASIELKAGRADKAIEIYGEFIDKNAEDARGYRSRSDLYFQARDFEKALGDLEKYVELEPTDFQRQLNRAILLRESGKTEKSIAALDLLAKRFPQRQAVYINRGVTFENLERYDEAIANLTRAMELSEEHRPYLLFHRATSRMGKKDFESALIDFNRVVELDPRTMAFVRRGELHEMMGNYDAAMQDFTKALELDPNSHFSRYRRALILESQTKDDEALAEYTVLVDKNIQSGRVYFQRAHVFKRKKKWELAVQDLETAVKLEPQDPVLSNDLAWILATIPVESLRNPQRAIEVASHACELTQWKKGLVLDTLAVAYASNGEFEKAVEMMEKALQLEDAKGRDDLQKRLELFRQKKPFVDQ